MEADGWELSGERLRIGSSEFRRKLSQETFEKVIVHNLGNPGKSLYHRIPPKLSLETPAASKLMLGGPGEAPWALPDPPKYLCILKFKRI